MQAVNAVKKSEMYRQYRSRLRSVVPSDAWVDENEAAYLVLFDLGFCGSRQSMLGFAVGIENRNVMGGVLSIDFSEVGWTFRNVKEDA